MNVPGGSVVRTFIARGVLCYNGDLISRILKTKGRLKACYACSMV